MANPAETSRPSDPAPPSPSPVFARARRAVVLFLFHLLITVAALAIASGVHGRTAAGSALLVLLVWLLLLQLAVLLALGWYVVRPAFRCFREGANGAPHNENKTSDSRQSNFDSMFTETYSNKEEEPFRLALESLPSAVVMINQEGRIVLVNAETERLFGYTRDELIGELVELLVPVRYRDHHPESRQSFFQNPQPRAMGKARDFYGLRKDGVEVPVEIGLNPIRTAEGTFVLSAIVDITERKRSEAALRKQSDNLEQKNRELEKFSYTVSHDLKSPLVTLSGFANYIGRDIEQGRFDRVPGFAEHIRNAVGRMKQTIDDLLTISRVGGVTRPPEPVNIKELIEYLLGIHGERIAEREVEVHLAPDLPTLLIDRQAIEQVLDNLISNALKYGCIGSRPRIIVDWQQCEHDVQLSVRDNGQGIDAKYHEKVFELFQRLQNDNEGTGVGLTLVRRTMEMLGGRTQLISEPGKGAQFVLSFPKSMLLDSAAAPSPQLQTVEPVPSSRTTP